MKKYVYSLSFVTTFVFALFFNTKAVLTKDTEEYKSIKETNVTSAISPQILYINNKKVVMDTPIIREHNRNFIPAEYIYKNIENSTGDWISDEVYHLNIVGNSLMFFNNHNIVFVNNIPTLMDVKSFTHNDKMYVPLHFIVKSLGGHARFKEDSGELLVYLDDFLFKNPIIKIVEGELPDAKRVPKATIVESKHLLVSDNPETLTHELVPDDESTLSMYHVQSSDKIMEHRVFGWHLNELGNPVTIGITVENTSSNIPIEVKPLKHASAISDTVRMSLEVGLVIADTLYYDNSKETLDDTIVIQPGETKVVDSFRLNDGRLLGFTHDFDIRAVKGDKMDYKIRTVLSKKNGNLTLIHTDPVPTDLGYARGAWEFSTILAELPVFTLGSPTVGYGISNGVTDHILTDKISVSPSYKAVGNVGHYGVDYRVKIPIVNPTIETKKVQIKLSGKGGIYSGAIRLNGQTFLVPDIKPGKNYAELPPITVEGGRTETIELEIMHAGGSFLPLVIYVEGN